MDIFAFCAILQRGEDGKVLIGHGVRHKRKKAGQESAIRRIGMNGVVGRSVARLVRRLIGMAVRHDVMQQCQQISKQQQYDYRPLHDLLRKYIVAGRKMQDAGCKLRRASGCTLQATSDMLPASRKDKSCRQMDLLLPDNLPIFQYLHYEIDLKKVKKRTVP
jgi:hypothetical protein